MNFNREPETNDSVEPGKVRYAVVGLGHISQAAVLPAFAHAKKHSTLAALVSSDPAKLKRLGKLYGVKHLYGYDRLEEGLAQAAIDAAYIALPNNLHREYTMRASRAGVHVLCEKPLGLTEEECLEMIEECRSNGTQLMTAYRLHFDEANLKAIQIAQSGRLGELRYFHSQFSNPTRNGIRLKSALGGGPLLDLGIYCINAARSLFQAEPTEALGLSATLSGDSRFTEVEEMASALLRFPEERLASFTCSFAGSPISTYEIVGTKGSLKVEQAFEYASSIRHVLTIGEKTTRKTFPKHDQFAPELEYFSRCVLDQKAPEPSGVEGLSDVRVIRAIYRSIQTGERAWIAVSEPKERPSLRLARRAPPLAEPPKLVHARSPSAR